MKIELVPGDFSYYTPPIKNTFPFSIVSLERVHDFIQRTPLKEVTQKVRSGEYIKGNVLPYITASGVFSERKLCKIISYSAIVSIDLDHCNIMSKKTLFEDPFLNPGLIFISPSRHGLKMFIRVRDADSDLHDKYFNAIAIYLHQKFGLNADLACRDITRACFLCHDEDAMLSLKGSVSSDDLIHSLPESFNVTGFQCFSSGSSSETLKHCKPETLPSNVEYNSTYDGYIMSKLNHCSAVHDYALGLLTNQGWSKVDEKLYRPGNNNYGGHSASYSFNSNYGIYLFKNWSSNSPVFRTDKSYTDCQVIAELAYNGDLKKCLSDLAVQFNSYLSH